MTDAATLMNRIYGTQRHIYDLTRKFYLLGRDELIENLAPPDGGAVLEIACGTARNLIAVARRYPAARCYGIDVSREMLTTAHRSLARVGLAERIALREADATTFDPRATFGIARFDRIFISYALSMIPPWQEVLAHAAGMLTDDGALHIVDFGDQAGLPRVFKRGLETWLSRYHVTPRASLPIAVADLARARGLQGRTWQLYRGYAVGAELSR